MFSMNILLKTIIKINIVKDLVSLSENYIPTYPTM